MIKYKPGLELWVRDTGQFEGYAVFLNGTLVQQVGDQLTNKFPIGQPSALTPIVIHFGGADGGISAIVDVSNPPSQVKLEAQSGLKHSYLIEP